VKKLADTGSAKQLNF